MKQHEGHQIKVVAQRTGLSTHVIRVWERRYNAVTPKRTASGRRIYTNTEIDRLLLLKRVIACGYTIGQIAHFDDAKLEEIIRMEEGRYVPTPRHTPQRTEDDPNRISDYMHAALDDVARLDSEALNERLQRASLEFSQVILLERLILPLMEEIGERWRTGSLRVSEEHLATATVQKFIANLKPQISPPTNAPSILYTTPAGDLHALGAEIAAAIAQSEGWRVTYMGPNLPAEEIASTARKKGVRAIGLSVIFPYDHGELVSELTRLQRLLGKGIAMIIGGRGAAPYREELQSKGIIFAATMQELRGYLEQLRQQPPDEEKRTTTSSSDSPDRPALGGTPATHWRGDSDQMLES